MNIACDGRALVGRPAGVGTWTTAVMGGLAATPGWRVGLAASRPLVLPAVLAAGAVDVLAPPWPRLPGTVWLHSLLPGQLERWGADAWVASLAVVPRRCPVPAVTVVHDLTPRTHPGHHTLANRFCFNAYLEESLERAAAVVTGAASVADELRAAFPWVAPRLQVIRDGVDAFFSPPPPGADPQPVRDHFAGGRPYLLHLGTLEPRKGLLTVLEAWERLRRRDPGAPDLVLAGQPGWGMRPLLERLAASPFADHLHRPGYVSREDARDLLRHAEAFVLATEAEGFGLPLAEALACGAPAVASDLPVLREVADDAALYAPVGDADAFTAAIARALEPTTATDLRRRALAHAPELGWEPAIAAWRELLRAVV